MSPNRKKNCPNTQQLCHNRSFKRVPSPPTTRARPRICPTYIPHLMWFHINTHTIVRDSHVSRFQPYSATCSHRPYTPPNSHGSLCLILSFGNISFQSTHYLFLVFCPSFENHFHSKRAVFIPPARSLLSTYVLHTFYILLQVNPPSLNTAHSLLLKPYPGPASLSKNKYMYIPRLILFVTCN